MPHLLATCPADPDPESALALSSTGILRPPDCAHYQAHAYSLRRHRSPWGQVGRVQHTHLIAISATPSSTVSAPSAGPDSSDSALASAPSERRTRTEPVLAPNVLRPRGGGLVRVFLKEVSICHRLSSAFRIFELIGGRLTLL